MSRIELRKFVIPEFIFGTGARLLAAQYAINLGVQKVMVVTDPGIIAAGWVDEILEVLRKHDVEHTVFDGLTSNPKDYEVQRGTDQFRLQKCNMLIALGGGSPIDCAKGIAILANNGGTINNFEGVDKIAVPMPPLICIPTTAGTSADISQFAIITDSTVKKKFAIISKAAIADLALIDPELTVTMNHELTASTGMDALVHAMESLVSNAHSDITDIHAIEAVRIISAILPRVLDNLNDPDLRTSMMLASLHAGIAFSNTSLGITHAMAHSLAGYNDAMHGICNTGLLLNTTAFNFDAAADQYRNIMAAMELPVAHDLSTDRETLLTALRGLIHKINLCEDLSDFDLRKEDIKQLAIHASDDPCMLTNPRQATIAEIEELYEKTLFR